LDRKRKEALVSLIAEGKARLPLPALLHQFGLGGHAKKARAVHFTTTSTIPFPFGRTATAVGRGNVTLAAALVMRSTSWNSTRRFPGGMRSSGSWNLLV
jgi:hypothetical protein